MIKNPFKYRDCPECEGSGYIESIDCSRSASDCCGGCYKKYVCDHCRGDGEFHSDAWEWKVYNYKERFRTKVDVKYWRLSCGISLDKIQFKLNQDKSLIKELYNILKPYDKDKTDSNS